MKNVMNFVLAMLCFFTFNVVVNAAVKENPVIQEIISEKEKTDKEKLTVKTEELDTDGGSEKINYYYKSNELKKIVDIFDTSNVVDADFTEETEYYLKNGKVYFIHIKEIYTKYDLESVTEDTVKEKKYYFDFKGKLVRYVDENGKIHENDSEMKKAYEDFKGSVSNKLKKYLKN